jgi:hypothetical protein
MHDLQEALASARDTIVFSSNDWSTARDFAWLYGIFVGWSNDPPSDDPDKGDALGELAARFGWSDEHKKRLRRLNAAVKSALDRHDDPAPAGRPAIVGSWWEVAGAVIPTVGQIQGSRVGGDGPSVFDLDVYRRGESGSKRTSVRLDLLRSVWAPIETAPDWVEVAW